MSRSLGIPVKLLHEAAGHIVTVELKSGELYRGTMIECEDNWNCQLESITYTAKDGKVSQLEHVFIRGSKVRFMVIPDMLKNAPMFKRLDARIKGKGSALGVGRGRAVAMRARAQAAGRGGPPGRGVPPIRRRTRRCYSWRIRRGADTVEDSEDKFCLYLTVKSERHSPTSCQDLVEEKKLIRGLDAAAAGEFGAEKTLSKIAKTSFVCI
ncbi:hypothetical protein ZIOFF_038046 [Zingiber officinale]|uniref:Small nuclear ribonucleoprotein Sm D3 n=2 Tax=Zingiber officinale TaxID=94328 RepID=A0A8J5GFV4_ZINOF|nr:hypothetical protein ZIOFF_038046 [Zingiber officinale]